MALLAVDVNWKMEQSSTTVLWFHHGFFGRRLRKDAMRFTLTERRSIVYRPVVVGPSALSFRRSGRCISLKRFGAEFQQPNGHPPHPNRILPAPLLQEHRRRTHERQCTVEEHLLLQIRERRMPPTVTALADVCVQHDNVRKELRDACSCDWS